MRRVYGSHSPLPLDVSTHSEMCVVLIFLKFFFFGVKMVFEILHLVFEILHLVKYVW